MKDNGYGCIFPWNVEIGQQTCVTYLHLARKSLTPTTIIPHNIWNIIVYLLCECDKVIYQEKMNLFCFFLDFVCGKLSTSFDDIKKLITRLKEMVVGLSSCNGARKCVKDTWRILSY